MQPNKLLMSLGRLNLADICGSCCRLETPPPALADTTNTEGPTSFAAVALLQHSTSLSDKNIWTAFDRSNHLDLRGYR